MKSDKEKHYDLFLSPNMPQQEKYALVRKIRYKDPEAGLDKNCNVLRCYLKEKDLKGFMQYFEVQSWSVLKGKTDGR